MKTEILSACDQLVNAALNGVYQGIIVVVLVGFGLRLLRRTNAATRHAVWFGTLVLLISLIPAHLLRDRQVANPRTDDADSSAPRRPVGSRNLTGPHATLVMSAAQPGTDSAQPWVRLPDESPVGDGQPLLSNPNDGSSLGTAGPPSGTAHIPDLGRPTDPIDADRSSDVVDSGREPATRSPTARRAQDPPGPQGAFTASQGPPGPFWRVERFLNPVSWNIASRANVPRVTGALLLTVWFMVAGARVVLLARRIGHLRKLKESASPPSGPLNELFHGLRRKLAIRRSVEMKVSSEYRSPVLLGFVHPVILLPAEEDRPTDVREAEQVLRHELAHVGRGDDWVNLVQQFIQATVFFHPAVWFVSRQLSLEREIACDDWVLQQGGRPRAYALLLADLAARIESSPPMLAPGISTGKSQLQQRINMILNTHRNTSPRLAKTRLGLITSAAALTAVLAIYCWPRLVLAQTATAPAAANAPRAASAAGGVAMAGPAVVAQATPPQALPPSSDAEPQPAPAPGDIGPGPKFKPDQPRAPFPPRPVAAPLSPLPPPDVVLVAPATPSPYVIGAPRFAAVPRPPGSPAARNADSSIEERLARLEEMVRSLMEQKDARGFSPRRSAAQDALINPKDVEQLKELEKEQAELAWRQANGEFEQAKRAAAEAKLATRQTEKERKTADERRAQGMHSEAFGKQLEGLKRARESLQREMERLDRQIERLEQERGRMQKDQSLLEENQDQLKDELQLLRRDQQQLLGEAQDEPPSEETGVQAPDTE